MNTDIEEAALEPASLLLKSRNFYVILILAQFFLLINGEYLYQIDAGAASLYLFVPITLIGYMLIMTKLDNGKPISWQDLESSMIGRKDFLSKYLRKADWSVSYFSLGVQLIYFTFAILLTSTILMVLIYQGHLQVGVVDAIQARSAIIYTTILVAPSETLIFHAIIPLWVYLTFAKLTDKMDLVVAQVEKRVVITYVVSQLIFGFYHFAAYGGNTTSIIMAIGMGMVFLYSARNFGIPFAIGVHAGWNLAIIGVLTSVIGG